MKREEAIKILSHPVKLGQGLIIENENTKLVGDAIDMAIISLKQEPKVGHWINRDKNGIPIRECSLCGVWIPWAYLVRNSYCPNCGCKMLKPQKVRNDMTECKECQHFYAYENICLDDNSRCYENGKCLHNNCEKFEVGTWGTPEVESE